MAAKPMSHEILTEMLKRSIKSNTEGVMLTRGEVASLLTEYAAADWDRKNRPMRQ